jgi:hypothetical protein
MKPVSAQHSAVIKIAEMVIGLENRSQKSGVRGNRKKLIELARGSKRTINADVGIISSGLLTSDF